MRSKPKKKKVLKPKKGFITRTFDISRAETVQKEKTVQDLPETTADDKKKKKQKKDSWLARLGTRKEREALVENLGLLLDSGLNLGLALDSLQRSTKSKYLKEKIETIIKSIEVGEPLWKSMKQVQLFPDHILAIIRSGEEGGRLPEILKLVTNQMERAAEFRSKLRSAMIYPAFVIIIAFAIMIISFTFTIPNMAKAFEDTTFVLPWPTRVLIAMGHFLEEWGNIFLPAVFAIFLTLIYFGFIYRKTRRYGQAILLKIPILRKLIQQIELSRMGYVMGNMLDSGFGVHESFGWLKEAATFERYREAYTAIQDKIGFGNTFEKSFASVKKLDKIIPDQYQQFIFAAEMSGNLSHAFTKMGQSFDSKIDVTTKNITIALEPTMLIGLGLFVFFVAYAIFAPIYSLIGAL